MGEAISKRKYKLCQGITYDLIDNICALVREGNYIGPAAQACNVTQQSVFLWMKKGNDVKNNLENGIEPLDEELVYLAFVDDLETAQAVAETRFVSCINRAAATDWKAASWHLERQHSHRWGYTQRTEVTNKNDSKDSINVTVPLSLSAMREVINTLSDSVGAKVKLLEHTFLVEDGKVVDADSGIQETESK